MKLITVEDLQTIVHIIGKTTGSVEIFKGLSSEEKERALKLNATKNIGGNTYIEYFSPMAESIVYLRLLEEDISSKDFRKLRDILSINLNKEEEDRELMLYQDLVN